MNNMKIYHFITILEKKKKRVDNNAFAKLDKYNL